MAEVKKEVVAPGSGDSSVIILVIVVLIALWFAQGSKRASFASLASMQSPIAANSKHQWLPFLDITTGSVVGGTVKNGLSNNQATIVGNGVSILDYYGARSSNPQQEYLVLYANRTNTAPISISGWQLHSRRTARTVSIGGGIETALIGQPTSPTLVMLAPGHSAVISTGRSPVGISFRENKCTGYLSQFQTFTPTLARKCPYPLPELASARPDLANDKSCANAANSMQPCKAFTRPPSNVTAECSNLLQDRLTYNGCVNAHRTDADFAGTQWYIFLGQTSEVWNNAGDTIDLLDMEGKTITTITY